MARKQAKPANTTSIGKPITPELLPATVSKDVNTSIQISASTDGTAVLDAMNRRDVDEAQLRILVRDTKKALQADLENEIPVLERLAKTHKESEDAIVKAIKATDVTAFEKKVERAVKALEELGFKDITGKVEIEEYDPQKGVRVELDVRFSSYDHNSRNEYLPPPKALRDALTARDVAADRLAAQRKLVEARRRELGEIERRVSEEGRDALDRRMVVGSDDGDERIGNVNDMVKRLIEESRARVAKSAGHGGKAQLEHKR